MPATVEKTMAVLFNKRRYLPSLDSPSNNSGDVLQKTAILNMTSTENGKL